MQIARSTPQVAARDTQRSARPVRRSFFWKLDCQSWRMSSKLSMHVPQLAAFRLHVRGTVAARAGLLEAPAAFPQNDVTPSHQTSLQLSLPFPPTIVAHCLMARGPLPGATWHAPCMTTSCAFCQGDRMVSSSFYWLPYSSAALLPSSELGHHSDSPIGLR